MSRPTWARWVTRISLVFAVVAMAVTIYTTGPRTIAHFLERIGWWWFAVVPFELAITSLDALAIRAFLSPEQARVRWRSALLAQLAGRAVNAVTPGGNLGEAVKVSVLVEHVSQARAVSTILTYNIVSFAIELLLVAVAALALVAFAPLPGALHWAMLAIGAVFAGLALLVYSLTRRGVVDGVARALRKLRLLSAERYERWRGRLLDIDSKMLSGARSRDRWLGLVAITASRLASSGLSLVLLHAIGEPITRNFIAAYTVGGFVIYMVGSLVPLGVGVNEGGYYALFKAIGEDTARGVTLPLARRVTYLMYAAIGLVLMTASETVQRAREHAEQRATENLGASPPHPAKLPEARIVTSSPSSAGAPVTEPLD
ncbi:MAG TPA: lysylphosphatidylglycerol synthase transmembrane domain-containing protein [Kofleriaceae bacterium]